MTSVRETAYPRPKPDISADDLDELYTPTPEEVKIVQSIAEQPRIRLAVMLHLKLHQTLGRFISLDEAPERIVRHVAEAMGYRRVFSLEDLSNYDASRRKRVHMKAIREYLNIRQLGEAGRRWLRDVAAQAAKTNHHTSDIINVMLEQLARHRYELPPFRLMDEIAGSARELANEAYFESINKSLSAEAQGMILSLLTTTPGTKTTAWNTLKREPRRPGNKEVRDYLGHVARLRKLADIVPPIDIPIQKLKYFRDMARSYDASELAGLHPTKRNALAVIYIRSQYGKTLDDAAELFIKLMQSLENTAQKNLMVYQTEHLKRTDNLIAQLRDILRAYQVNGSAEQRIDAIGNVVGDDVTRLLIDCDEHMAFAGQHFIPFLAKPYANQRALLLNCVQIMSLRSSSNDPMTERLLAALEACRNQRRDVIETTSIGLDAKNDFDWLSGPWRREVFPKSWGPDRAGFMQRRFFELAVLYQIKDELKSGDVYIPGGERFDDYREQFVDDDTFHKELDDYGEASGIETNPSDFVTGLREAMREKCSTINARFAENPHASIVDGRLILRKMQRNPITRELALIDTQLIERLAPVSIMDVLVDVTSWVGLERHFRPLAGTGSRLEDLRDRVITTLFCFGCNLGPTQTARSVRGLSRKQLAWLNLKYVTEETQERVTNDLINEYNRYELPGYWGSGQSASADGTKWSMYSENIVSEQHIRYGGYGGIGYYHVSDKYIALLSRFITCSAHESLHILDVLENKSDIQPDRLHGDTHSQSFPVFALAYLLGVELMPRIKNVGDLTLSKPDASASYPNMQSLYSDGAIDWNTIETHLHDMLRVGISIKTGKITSSTILRRLGSASRKNKLYFAFRELGRVIRTMFLLDYIDDIELRKSIHAATNKSEEFNNFTQWAFFGGKGIIAENIRHEQQKVVGYNHIVANMVILYNVEHMSRVLTELREEGIDITPEILAGLSPYRTSHINRFGDYTLDTSRDVSPNDVARRILRKIEKELSERASSEEIEEIE